MYFMPLLRLWYNNLLLLLLLKNDIEGQRTRSGPESRRNGRFYVRPKSGFWPKNGSYPKKSPKMTFSPLIIWAKATFFFEQLFPVVARTWLESKSERLFLGPKSRFLVQKSVFAVQPQFWSMTHFKPSA